LIDVYLLFLLGVGRPEFFFSVVVVDDIVLMLLVRLIDKININYGHWNRNE